MPRIVSYIGLGSNLENPQQQLRTALKALAVLPSTELVSNSSFYRSVAVGPGQQPDYINAVCRLDTELSAVALLAALQQIENAQGRVRTQKWGPRTLDLDLLLYGNQRIALPDLQVPHPRMFERNFVLFPLAEIATDLVFTRELGLPKQVAIESLLAQVGHADLERLQASGDYLE